MVDEPPAPSPPVVTSVTQAAPAPSRRPARTTAAAKTTNTRGAAKKSTKPTPAQAPAAAAPPSLNTTFTSSATSETDDDSTVAKPSRPKRKTGKVAKKKFFPAPDDVDRDDSVEAMDESGATAGVVDESQDLGDDSSGLENRFSKKAATTRPKRKSGEEDSDETSFNVSREARKKRKRTLLAESNKGFFAELNTNT